MNTLEIIAKKRNDIREALNRINEAGDRLALIIERELSKEFDSGVKVIHVTDLTFSVKVGYDDTVLPHRFLPKNAKDFYFKIYCNKKDKQRVSDVIERSLTLEM